MKKRILAALMVLSMMLTGLGYVPVQAAGNGLTAKGAESVLPAAEQEIQSSQTYVYGKEGETTFVPAGYTYVYQNEDGEMLHMQTVSRDTYISERTLTPEEAEALHALEYGGESYTTNSDGTVSVSREYNAAEAAAYSTAVQAILNGEEVQENDTVRLRVEGYTQDQEIPVMIVFEDPSVSQMETMTVKLGEAVGTAEIAAMQSIQARQIVATTAISRELGYDIQVDEQFALLTNAVSATVKYGDLDEINEMKGVKYAYVMPIFSVPEVDATDVESAVVPNMKYVGEGMGSNVAWDLGYQGEGMSVAIIDTGITLTNPSFIQEPVDQELVAYTKDDIQAILSSNFLHAEALAEDVTADTLYYSSKIPFGFDYADRLANYGDDFTDLGHGSHVAGIVAGNLSESDQERFEMHAMGIAPEAQLIAMKVFDQNGNGPMVNVVAAMEDAILLGVDCANLSLGVDCGPCYREGVTEVFDAAYEAGINVVVSAGNSSFTGYNSLWGGNMVESSSVSTGTLGMPGTFDSVLTVASAENGGMFNANSNGLCYKYNGREVVMEYAQPSNTPAGKTLKAALNGKTYPLAISMEDAKDKLLVYGIEKDSNVDPIIAQAAEAGVVGLIFYNANPADDFDKYVNLVTYTVTDFTVPSIGVGWRNGTYLMTTPPEEMYIPLRWKENPAAGEMSSFSSWGPSETLSLKPEITGIGGNVFSAYGDGFAVLSGTSMSSPAVAATAALVRQYLKTTSIAPEDYAHVVNCLLMSTATPIVDAEHDTYYFVRRQGAGMANAADAIHSGAYIQVEGANKAKLELGDDPDRTGVYEMTFEVVNFSDVNKTYTLDTTTLGQVAEGGQIKAGEVTYLVYDYAKELNPDVVYSAEGGQITVPAGSAVEVTVTLTLSDADRSYMEERFPYGSYVEGFVHLTSEDSVPLNVPFLAFYGDFSEGPIFEEGTYDNLLGKYAYNTADHAHNELLTYVPDSREASFPGIFDTETATERSWYPGDTLYKEKSKVPESLLDEISAYDRNVLPFYSQHAGISPNGDNVMDILGMSLGLKRNAKELRFTVTNRETGELIWEQTIQDMYKTFFSDNAGGVLACSVLSMEWLYPIVWETDFYGNPVGYYDSSRCLLEENTWVDMKVEAISEYGDGTGSVGDTVEFSLYVDTTPPIASMADVTVGAYESSSGDTHLYFEEAYHEQWFTDTAMSGFCDFNEETQAWEGMIWQNYDCAAEPGDSRVPYTGHNMYFGSDKLKYISLVYDYAGNAFAYQVETEHLPDLVELEAEKTTIHVGESVTVRNASDFEGTTKLIWKSSDESIATTSYDSSGWGESEVTVQGVAPGTVTILGGYGNGGKWMKSIEITVLPEGDCPHTNTELRGAKAATCTEDGYSGDVYCTVCGALVSAGEVIPAHCASKSFTDVDTNQWYHTYVDYVVDHGIMNGMGGGRFAPNGNVTRAQLVTTLYRMAGSPQVEEMSTFADVPANRWYSAAVAWAQDVGVAVGVTETAFQPNDSTTREQAATFLYRYVTEYLKQEPTQGADLSAYQDAASISPYAEEALAWATAEGILEGFGDDTLKPKDVLSRAQLAKLMTIMDQNF